MDFCANLDTRIRIVAIGPQAELEIALFVYAFATLLQQTLVGESGFTHGLGHDAVAERKQNKACKNPEKPKVNRHVKAPSVDGHRPGHVTY